jgi:aldose 1-epimerase
MAYREWQIGFGQQQATICARGGALRSYDIAGRAVIDGFAADELPPAFNGAVLAPWPNRIRDGRWNHEGRPQQLAISEPARGTALHGLVAWQNWQLVSATEQAVGLNCQVPAQPGYPFELELSVQWSLDEAGLRCELIARNTGSEPAPFGAATHPFFGFDGVTVDELSLTLPAASWLKTDERLLPDGLREVAGTGYDFRDGQNLRGVSLDTAFTAVARNSSGKSIVELRGPAGVITIWADDRFGWWQVYTSDMFDPSDARYRRSVAIEAMTCGPEAFNTGLDVIWLPTGGDWHGSWGIQA